MLDVLEDYLVPNFLQGTQDVAVEELTWQRWNVQYSRDSPAGTSEDRAQFGIDIVNMTGGDIDLTWDAADFAAVDAAFSNLVTSLRAYQSPAHRAVRYEAHTMHFSPSTWPVKRFADAGAPSYALNLTPTAGAGTIAAYQVAATVTERTSLQAHWGRAYIPGLAGGALDSFGRISTTARAGILAAFGTFITALKTADFYIVVPMTQHNKLPAFGLLSLSQLVVDDVPDVQRRRRPKQVAARSILP